MSQATAKRTLLGVCVLTLVLAFAALGAGSVQPPVVQRMPDPPAPTAPEPPSEPGAEPSSPFSIPPQDDVAPLEMPPWLGDTIWSVLILAGIVLAGWIVVQLVRRQLALRRPPEPDAEVRSEAITNVDEEDLAESFNTALARLGQGVSVDDVIVDCWRHLESLAADAGVVRASTQTSQEFTVEVLRHTDADQPSLERLGDLYRRATYSTHRFTDADRDSAVGALETLAASVGERAR